MPVSDAHEPDGPREQRVADPQVDALLRAAHDQRAALAAQLKQVERELRAARQGEQAERARRSELEDETAELRRLRQELARRGQVHHAVSRQLAALRTSLQETRAQLAPGDGVEGPEEQLAAAREELRIERARRLSAEAAVVERRAVEEQVASALTDLRAELVLVREEAAARDAREVQLRQLVVELVSTADALKAGFERELAELQEQLARRDLALPAAVEAARAEERIVELEDELEQARIALRPPAPMPPADHPALSGPPPAADAVPTAADSVIIDLARAAARLRTRRGEEDDAVLDAETAPAADPGPTPRPVELGPRFTQAARPAGSAWLAAAIGSVARRDALAAARIIAALLPLQAARRPRELTYDMSIAGQLELRVALYRDGTADVSERAPEAAETGAAFRLAGSPVALAYYAAGGIGHRTPPGVLISGRRRHARRLAKAMREPVALPALEALGPPALLTVLAQMIDPAATRGEGFTVAFADGEHPPSAHLVVADGRPPAVHAGPPVYAAATVRSAPDGLAAFLAGTGSAQVTGDAGAVRRLLSWVDAAQGLRA